MKNLTSISLEEQKRLQHGIESSLSLQDTLESMIVRVPTDPAALTPLLQKDWAQARIGERLNHRVKNLISVKTEKEFLLEAKLSSLRSRIREQPQTYVDFSRRVFLPALAEKIYLVYLSIRPLVEPLQRLTRDLDQLQKLLRSFIERNLQNPKTALVDFISIEEMKQLFFQSESKQDLIGEIRNRLERYFNSLDEEAMRTHQKAVLPFYSLRNLTLFPFEDTFQCFKVRLAKDVYPKFEEAEVSPAIEYLEQFFCALYPFHAYEAERLLPKEILVYLAGTLAGSHEIHRMEEVETSQVESARQILRSIVQTCQKILREVPLVEMIRYFREDPYYRVLLYQPKVRLKEFYIHSLTLKVFRDFEAFFSKIRFDILEDLMQNLFKGEPIAEFQYYMNAQLNLVPKQGYPGFTHHRSLVLLNNFIRKIYAHHIQDTIHILNRTITNRIRDSVSLMLLHASGIEETEERLAKFDASFAPDTDAGKMMGVMKLVIDRDPKQQKLYRSLIAEKDREGKEILEKGLTHLEGLLIGFQTVAKDRVFLKDTSRRFATIESRVSNSLNYLLWGTKALRYLMAMEKGAI
ncbi:MAG: hypothetical protein Kow009_09430 [Spirochaetales bacterium]